MPQQISRFPPCTEPTPLHSTTVATNLVTLGLGPRPHQSAHFSKLCRPQLHRIPIRGKVPETPKPTRLPHILGHLVLIFLLVPPVLTVTREIRHRRLAHRLHTSSPGQVAEIARAHNPVPRGDHPALNLNQRNPCRSRQRQVIVRSSPALILTFPHPHSRAVVPLPTHSKMPQVASNSTTITSPLPRIRQRHKQKRERSPRDRSTRLRQTTARLLGELTNRSAVTFAPILLVTLLGTIETTTNLDNFTRRLNLIIDFYTSTVITNVCRISRRAILLIGGSRKEAVRGRTARSPRRPGLGQHRRGDRRQPGTCGQTPIPADRHRHPQRLLRGDTDGRATFADPPRPREPVQPECATRRLSGEPRRLSGDVRASKTALVDRAQGSEPADDDTSRTCPCPLFPSL